MKFFYHSKLKRPAWNKGLLIGQKPPLKLKDVWAIKIRLKIYDKVRDLAMFSLGLDSKLRGCDLVRLRVSEVMEGTTVKGRVMVLQKKTGRPVRFEISKSTQEAVLNWVQKLNPRPSNYLFPSRVDRERHISTRQYARLLKSWVQLAGLDPNFYGTHSIRRTKASLIYKKTKNLRAVQLLLGHARLDSTIRYLGIDENDALEISEGIEI